MGKPGVKFLHVDELILAAVLELNDPTIIDIMVEVERRAILEGCKHDARGVLIPMDTIIRCSCNDHHVCKAAVYPITQALIRPRLDRIERAGLVVYVPPTRVGDFGTWRLPAVIIPDSLGSVDWGRSE